jgi:hypothetical protein
VASITELYSEAKYGAVLGVVTNSVEFKRILALPRRVLDLSNVPDVTPLFAKTGEMAFRPIQSAALVEAAIADGLFGMIGVGFGKELICFSLPEAMDSKKTVLLLPTDLRRQAERESRDLYGKHFNLPLDRIKMVTYDELSSRESARVLEEENPDLIICNEAQNLRRKESARTKRFLRFAKEHPECRYVFLSGTMTQRSINDYSHMLELALRKNSPVPRGYRESMDWAGALDVNPAYRMAAGVLKTFCDDADTVRDGYRKRLVQTQGVVATEEGAIGTSLVFHKLAPPVPQKVELLMAQVRKTWSLDGEEYTTALVISRIMRQLRCGFHYRWVWPNGEPDYEWLDARAAWNKEVRERLKFATEGMDSPGLLAQAAERGDWQAETWHIWKHLKGRTPPPTEAVWHHDFLLKKAISWAKKQDAPAIIWYHWRAVGERLAELGKLPLYDAGTDASESKEDVIIASIRAQGTGKNLQHYARNLVITLPPNNMIVEQLVGRTHRPGQEAGRVTVDWFGHTPEAIDAMGHVIDDAHYQQKTTGQKQKVLYATRLND